MVHMLEQLKGNIMGKIKDLNGLIFSRWTVLEFSHIDQKNKAVWLCKCECGTERAVSSHSLNKGDSKSCGCLMKEAVSAAHKTHGLSKTKLHEKWRNMLSRCQNDKDPSYLHYGGRGISVSDRWQVFENFYTDNKEYESAGLSLDRIDVNGNYEQENCRWTTMKVQQNNRRSNVHIEYNGMSKTVSEWADHLGMNYYTLWSRLRDGIMPIEVAMTNKGSLRSMANKMNAGHSLELGTA